MDKILDEKKRQGKTFYLVKFIGFAEPEWIEKSNVNAEEAIEDWKNLKKSKKQSAIQGYDSKIHVQRIVSKRED